MSRKLKIDDETTIPSERIFPRIWKVGVSIMFPDIVCEIMKIHTITIVNDAIIIAKTRVLIRGLL